MRNALGVLALGGAAWLGACAGPAETTTAALELSALPSCELPRADRVAVRASGDFATRPSSFAARASFDYDSFPLDTRFLAFEIGAGDARAGGVVALSGADVRRAVWMLPFGRSCPLGDPLAVAPDGAVLGPLADGGVLIAGGRDETGAASASALVLAPGAALAGEVEGGMLFRRIDASATAVARGVLIVGGGADDYPRATERMQMRSAHDTFELFVGADARFDRPRKLASGPRRNHGALALADGRVLIAGGVSALGREPLRSAELIDPVTLRARALDAELEVARTAPALLALDSGAVLVALGGADGDGDTDTEAPLREVERFDVAGERFEALDVVLPDHAQAAVAALEGDRVAYVGCDGVDAPCEIALLLPDGGGFALARPDFAGAALLDDADGMRGLSQLRLLPLHDGRLLVTGRGQGAGASRRGFVVDFNARAIARAEVSRAPSVLLELADGSRVEADASGLSLARSDAQSVLDDAPAELIGRDATALALDDAARWRVEDRTLVARSAARADVPYLRFAGVRVELTWTGEGEVLLEPAGAPAVSIGVRGGTLALGECAVEHIAKDAIAIERRGDRVRLRSGERVADCDAPQLGARVGIALRAERGARVAGLRVTRL
jgi:hypothetical protein